MNWVTVQSSAWAIQSTVKTLVQSCALEVRQSPCHTVMSHSHVTRSCHTVIMSHSHHVTQSPCHTVTMSTQSPCHTVTMVTQSPCHTVTMSHSHHVTRSPCHTVTMSHGHHVTHDLKLYTSHLTDSWFCFSVLALPSPTSSGLRPECTEAAAARQLSVT